MTTAWRGENENWTAEERAAHILAQGFGYGSCWERNFKFSKPTAWRAGDAGDESTPAATAGLHVNRETETLELASRAIHPDAKKQPKWVRELPEAERAEALAWSEQHRLHGIGEFERWKTATPSVCVPHVRSGSEVAAALAMSRMPGPLRPLLLLYALQDETQGEVVLRYACACGARPEIARDALVRVLSPGRIPRGQAKPSLRMRRSEYSKQLRAIQARLEQWLHRAATEFLRAYGQAVRKRPGASRFLANDLYR